ncbi:MAG TPA: hypothetical protein VJ208_01810 [Candidatus Nanoarchaeia archaeon]|nr:hypothetical protein [Candidatus Nanoarchaeia archaeon]
MEDCSYQTKCQAYESGIAKEGIGGRKSMVVCSVEECPYEFLRGGFCVNSGYVERKIPFFDKIIEEKKLELEENRKINSESIFKPKRQISIYGSNYPFELRDIESLNDALPRNKLVSKPASFSRLVIDVSQNLSLIHSYSLTATSEAKKIISKEEYGILESIINLHNIHITRLETFIANNRNS